MRKLKAERGQNPFFVRAVRFMALYSELPYSERLPSSVRRQTWPLWPGLATYRRLMTGVETAESEVVSLRKLAKQMADSRRESLTTAHLLVAIASRQSPAADLLLERRLDTETLARLARASSEDTHDPIGQAIRRATAVARSAGAREPKAVHLLLALLREKNSGAFRALLQSGIDMARLLAAREALKEGLPGEPVYGHVPDAGLPKTFHRAAERAGA